MVGIVSASVAQVQTARDATFKLARALQQIVDGTGVGPAQQNPAQIAIVDALVDAQVAAVAPLNT